MNEASWKIEEKSYYLIHRVVMRIKRDDIKKVLCKQNKKILGLIIRHGPGSWISIAVLLKWNELISNVEYTLPLTSMCLNFEDQVIHKEKEKRKGI